MRVFLSSRSALASTIFVALFVACHGAMAGVDFPALKLTMQVDGGQIYEYSPIGSANEDGTFSYGGYYEGEGWDLDFSALVNPDPSVSNTIGVHNDTAVVKTYIFTVFFPIAPIPGGSLMDGSVSGSVQDFSGDGFAEMTTSGPTPIYTGLIDGLPVPASFLLPAAFATAPVPFAGGFSFFGSSFGLPLPPSVPGPAVAASIGIQLMFTLTPGDDVAITSGFFVEPVPAPAGLALLGLAGLLGSRRRR
jgi:MYXO-CTERM domain-containing protein